MKAPRDIQTIPTRVSVIGFERVLDAKKHEFTMYRTLVVYDGSPHERLIRFSQFYAFYHYLSKAEQKQIGVHFPKKRFRKASNKNTKNIKERVKDLNAVMSAIKLTNFRTKAVVKLHKMLMIGDYTRDTVAPVQRKNIFAPIQRVARNFPDPVKLTGKFTDQVNDHLNRGGKPAKQTMIKTTMQVGGVPDVSNDGMRHRIQEQSKKIHHLIHPEDDGISILEGKEALPVEEDVPASSISQRTGSIDSAAKDVEAQMQKISDMLLVNVPNPQGTKTSQ